MCCSLFVGVGLMGVASCSLFCWLLVGVCRMLCVLGCCWLFVFCCCSLCVVCCVLRVDCSLCVIRWLLFVVCCCLCVVCMLLLLVCVRCCCLLLLLFAVGCVVFAVYRCVLRAVVSSSVFGVYCGWLVCWLQCRVNGLLMRVALLVAVRCLQCVVCGMWLVVS